MSFFMKFVAIVTLLWLISTGITILFYSLLSDFTLKHYKVVEMIVQIFFIVSVVLMVIIILCLFSKGISVLVRAIVNWI